MMIHPRDYRHHHHRCAMHGRALAVGSLLLLLGQTSVSTVSGADTIATLDIDETTIAAGIEHSCAIHTHSYNDVGGRVLCWGSDYGGQSSPPSVGSII